MGRIIAENKHTGKLYPVDSKAIYRVIYEVVDVLPTENIKTSVIYCVPIIGKENEYDMFLYIDSDWVSVGSGSIDLSDYCTKEETAELLSDKMDLAPLNPTAEQIAALPAGQLYSDTANHKGVIKGGQSFYSTEYINGNYRKTVYHSYYRPPCVIQSPNAFNIGDTWITHDSKADSSDRRDVSSTDRVYRLLEIQESAYIQGDYIYIWGETTNNAFWDLSNYMLSAEAVHAVDYGSPLGMCTEDGLLSVGDIVWTKDVNDNITGAFLVTKTNFEYNDYWNFYIKNIESIELSIPYNTYTKTETNTLLADKMGLAPLNPTAQEIEAMPSGQLYGDNANHKSIIKGGQSFYDTVYIDENYRKTYTSDELPPHYCIGNDTNDMGFNLGDKWVFNPPPNKGYNDSDHREYVLTQIVRYGIYGVNYKYIWVPTTRLFYDNLTPLPTTEEPINASYTINGKYYDAWALPRYSLNDVFLKNGAYYVIDAVERAGTSYSSDWVYRVRHLMSETEIDNKGYLTLETLPIYDGTVI